MPEAPSVNLSTIVNRRPLEPTGSRGLSSPGLELALPRYQETFSLDLTHHQALRACGRAVATLGWQVVAQGEHGLVCTETQPASACAWPLQVEIVLAGDPAGPTSIALHGLYCGWGLMQSGYAQRQIQALRACIEEVARSRR